MITDNIIKILLQLETVINYVKVFVIPRFYSSWALRPELLEGQSLEITPTRNMRRMLTASAEYRNRDNGPFLARPQ